MPSEKIVFEQLLEAVEAEQQGFIEKLHNYLLEQGCKASYELKKNGPLASYKYGKPPRTLLNFIFRSGKILIRIYGENVNKYEDSLGDFPDEMVASIRTSGDCRRMVHNTCSTKCNGYDFMIKGERFQKCRYNCFELLVSGENNPYIKQFIAQELDERMVK